MNCALKRSVCQKSCEGQLCLIKKKQRISSVIVLKKRGARDSKKKSYILRKNSANNLVILRKCHVFLSKEDKRNRRGQEKQEYLVTPENSCHSCLYLNILTYKNIQTDKQPVRMSVCQKTSEGVICSYVKSTSFCFLGGYHHHAIGAAHTVEGGLGGIL